MFTKSHYILLGLLIFLSAACDTSGNKSTQNILSQVKESKFFEWPFSAGMSQTFTYKRTLGNVDTAKLNSAAGVAIDSDDTIYVSDFGNHLIKKYDSSGNFIMQWGGYGSLPGKLNIPCELAIDRYGFIYVADLGNNRIQKFTKYGMVVQIIGTGYLANPRSVTVSENGDIYAMNEFDNSVCKFNTYGIFLKKWGEEGFQTGQFMFPNSISYYDGKLYVADTQNNRIQVFDEEGNFIQAFGSYGSGNENLYYPRSIFIDKDNGTIYVGDTFNNRVMIYDNNFTFIKKIEKAMKSKKDSMMTKLMKKIKIKK